MQTMPADRNPAVRQLIDAAAREPLTLTDNGTPATVILPPAEFQRLDEQDRIRREAKLRLRETVASIQAEAAEKALQPPS